ncbi:hypothetical protein NLJ27_28045, partial [Escherichia coli]|nr:hypothetical protein [Escherichia coli]
MVTKTITEQRAEVRIFAGNDPAHTATGSSGISSASPSSDACDTPPWTAAGEWFAMKCSNMAAVDAETGSALPDPA